MKKAIKLLSMLMTVLLVFGTLSACGGKGGSEASGGKNIIQISYWNSGLGSKWIENMIKAFEKKYPQYKVKLEATASQDAFIAPFGLEDADTYDLYLGTLIKSPKYCIDLKNVLEYTPEGESKPIKDKFYQYYLDLEKQSDGKIVTLSSGGGIYGVVYNKKIFEKSEIKQLPRTTNELALTASTVTDSGIPAFAHFNSRGYWHWMQYLWTLQYEGKTNFNNLYMNPSRELLMKKDGRYQTIKVLEKLITSQNTLTGSNSESHIAMQTRLLQEKCAMMVNGSWLINEMPDTKNPDDFEMMRTPVISSITDKLSTVKNETVLRKLISAIDNVTDKTESEDKYKSGSDYAVEGNSISAADWNYVKTARNTYPSATTGNSAFIPSYSDAIEGAELFLKYYYSDEGMKIFIDATHIPLPMSFDKGEVETSKWNAFEKNQLQLYNICEQYVDTKPKNANELYTVGGADIFADINFITPLCTTSETDRMSGDKLWDKMATSFNDNYDTWLSNIK